MADKKNKVIVYKDWISTFEKLSDDEAGKLIKHFFQYINDLNPESDDRLITLLFEPIKQTLKRDLKAYEARCKKNTEAIEKRWNESNTNVVDEVQTNTNVYKRIQPNTKHTDSDNDSDSDNDTEKNISVSESAHALIKFIKDKCPQVHKMKYPLTLEESERLVNEYSKSDIAKLFNEMDNWADLKKKTSANKTFRSWAQRGGVKKLTDQYKHTPKLVNVNLPPQLVTELNNQFGLPLDWNEYDDFNRVTFIKKTPSIRHYFDLRGLGI